MNLHKLLCERAASGRPLRVGLIGAGKFGTMFLAQALRTPGLHLLGVADLAPRRARDNLLRVGWPAERIDAASLGEAADGGTTWIGDDARTLISHPALDVVIDATGHPPSGIANALAAIANGKHIVMVNVEADVLAGPLLAQKARAAGVVYSLAYGDQPALIAEQVDWARACGFDVVAAGKGTKYLPAYHQSTPETVWAHYGLTPEQARLGGTNAQMFNSFLDGTKSAIEMAAVANATGLTPAPDGLRFPPCGVDDLPSVLRPEAEGGQLHHKGQVEVVSSLARDGGPVFRDLRWGVHVVFEAPSDYVQRCFAEYGLVTDPSGRYSALYKPYHLIGLELG
ncbi:MAG: NAD(P)H-dependent oxidoreductase, partial [Dongiaceae bacterium]